MIDALFGFRGYLGRLAFLGWNLAGMALVGAITVAFLILGAGLAVVGVPSWGATILGLVMALTAGGAGICMTSPSLANACETLASLHCRWWSGQSYCSPSTRQC
jgi:hypothetical protein